MASLIEEQRKNFDQQSYLLMRGLIDPRDVDRMPIADAVDRKAHELNR